MEQTRKKMPWSQNFVACNIRMPDGINKLLLQKSKKERVSKSSLIVKAVTQYLQASK